MSTPVPNPLIHEDRARSLAAFYAAGCVLTTAAGALPVWPDDHRVVLLSFAGLTGLAAIGLWVAQRRLRAAACHVVVVCGSLLIGACIVSAGQRGGPAFAFAMVWVGVWCAMFLPPPAVAAHVALAGAVQAWALVDIGAGAGAAPQVVMQVGVTTVAAVVVGSLVARTRALATTDPLTGLANRRGFEAAVERELARHRRHGGALAVLALDLDAFKAVNDSWGHEAGDGLLQRAAAAWRDELREVDVVGRSGGDEFAVLLPGVGAAQAATVAERLADVTPGPVGVSVGIAGPRPGDDARSLLHRADQALYEVKRARHLPERPGGPPTTAAEGGPPPPAGAPRPTEAV